MARHRDPRPAKDLRYTEAGRRVRARSGGVDVADSLAPLLVWEPGRPVPLYAFPKADVALGSLEPGAQAPQRAHPVAEAWRIPGADGTHAAAWTYDDPDLAGHVVFDWNAIDTWLEEDEEVFVHPRDPFHRVELRASSRHVRIAAGDVTLAETQRPLLLFETGLPVRSYLPADDVRMDLLEPTSTRTRCPYKGEAAYWSVTGSHELTDVAWSYPDPVPEVLRIAGLIAFFDERVDVHVDGQLGDRPVTPWSRR